MLNDITRLSALIYMQVYDKQYKQELTNATNLASTGFQILLSTKKACNIFDINVCSLSILENKFAVYEVSFVDYHTFGMKINLIICRKS